MDGLAPQDRARARAAFQEKTAMVRAVCTDLFDMFLATGLPLSDFSASDIRMSISTLRHILQISEEWDAA